MYLYVTVLCIVCMQYLHKPEEGLRFFGTGVTDGYELSFVGKRINSCAVKA